MTTSRRQADRGAGRSEREGVLVIYLCTYQPKTRKEDREREHVLGRSLLQFGLGQEFGRSFEIDCPPCKKPVLKGIGGISFNISHTQGLVVCAVSQKKVGVDTELIRDFRESMIMGICSQQEAAYVERGGKDLRAERFFRLWTLKESFVKAVGCGLAFPLKEITFSVEQDKSIKGSIPGWHFYQSKVYGKYIISVCEADQEGEQNDV